MPLSYYTIQTLLVCSIIVDLHIYVNFLKFS